MKRPSIRGLKTKAIRIDPKGLAEFRERLKANPSWVEYAEVSESDLITLAVVLASLHIRPELISMTMADIHQLVDEAVRINIARVAQALGGVAQMGPGRKISVTRPESDSINTFEAEPVKPKSTPLIN